MLKRIKEQSISNFIYSFFLKEIFIFLENLRPIKQLPLRYHHGGPCIPGARRLFLNVDGDFYPCERVSEKSDIMKFGNIDTGIDLKKARRILNIGKISEEKCKNCWAIHHCSLCAAYADTLTDLSVERKSQFCEGVRKYVDTILKDICTLMELGYNLKDENPI